MWRHADRSESHRSRQAREQTDLICDARGVPLAIRLTGANRNDSQEALALVDAIPRLQGRRGRPRCRPACVTLGDRGYDAASIRSGLRTRQILPLLAMRRTKMAAAWDGGAGLLSGHSHGCINSAVYASAATNGPTSTRRSSHLAVHGSAGSRCGRLNDGLRVKPKRVSFWGPAR